MSQFASFMKWSGTYVSVRCSEVISVTEHPRDGDRPDDAPSCHLELAHSKSTIRVRGDHRMVLELIEAAIPDPTPVAPHREIRPMGQMPGTETENRIIDVERFAGKEAVLQHDLDSTEVFMSFYDKDNDHIRNIGDPLIVNNNAIKVDVPEWAVKAIVVRKR